MDAPPEYLVDNVSQTVSKIVLGYSAQRKFCNEYDGGNDGQRGKKRSLFFATPIFRAYKAAAECGP